MFFHDVDKSLFFHFEFEEFPSAIPLQSTRHRNGLICFMLYDFDLRFRLAPAELHLTETQTVADLDMQQKQCAIPAVVSHFDTAGVKAKWKLTCRCHRLKEMSLQISSAVVRLLWLHGFKCSNTKKYWQKMLSEHWLSISQSYKKHHGFQARVGAQFKSCTTAITFYFLGLFWWISLPCSHAD